MINVSMQPSPFVRNSESESESEVTQSCLTLCDPMVGPWDSLGKNTGMGCHSLLQGSFPTQGSNPGLSHCRQMLYCLRHQESPNVQMFSCFLGPPQWLRG